jgi:hypothetical protein
MMDLRRHGTGTPSLRPSTSWPKADRRAGPADSPTAVRRGRSASVLTFDPDQKNTTTVGYVGSRGYG